VRLLNRTTRSVSLTEAGEAYFARIGPAVTQVIEASEDMNVLQGRPAGTLRLNAARISVTLVLQPILADFFKEYPNIQLELTNDEGFVDIVERGFDAGVRLGESVHQDMVAVPLTRVRDHIAAAGIIEALQIVAARISEYRPIATLLRPSASDATTEPSTVNTH